MTRAARLRSNSVMQRILVIDDDASVRSFLKRGLSFEGFQVDTAESGELGLRIALDRTPHLILLDLLMPGMGGGELAACFQANP